jgi:hypothetical protein
MSFRLAVLLLVFSTIFPSVLLGQLTSATLTGRVTDSTGSAIPNALVTATDSTTGVIIHAETDGQGDYALTGLAPDTYRLIFSKDGFQSYGQNGLIVTVGQRATVNAELLVGAVSQSVIVEAASEMINVQSPTVSTSIDNKMTQQLPLNGRNYCSSCSLPRMSVQRLPAAINKTHRVRTKPTTMRVRAVDVVLLRPITWMAH